jgi:hypothetical protein
LPLKPKRGSQSCQSLVPPRYPAQYFCLLPLSEHVSIFDYIAQCEAEPIQLSPLAGHVKLQRNTHVLILTFDKQAVLQVKKLTAQLIGLLISAGAKGGVASFKLCHMWEGGNTSDLRMYYYWFSHGVSLKLREFLAIIFTRSKSNISLSRIKIYLLPLSLVGRDGALVRSI